MLILTVYGIPVTAASAFLFVALVPADVQPAWLNVPLLGIVQHLSGPVVAPRC